MGWKSLIIQPDLYLIAQLLVFLIQYVFILLYLVHCNMLSLSLSIAYLLPFYFIAIPLYEWLNWVDLWVITSLSPTSCMRAATNSNMCKIRVSNNLLWRMSCEVPFKYESRRISDLILNLLEFSFWKMLEVALWTLMRW